MTTAETLDDRARLIAERGTILRVQVGSGVHGVTTGDDDRDEMGICVEPADYVIGLGRFEQYEYRTQPQGVRSGPGDLDLVIYSLRKWLRLALQGNPSILLPLFVPNADVVSITWRGVELRRRPELVISKQAGARFLGYMQAQRQRLLGLRGGRHTNRPELIERYGFDTKLAYHMIRLGIQGTELMETGQITLPMPQPHRGRLIELRRGGYSKEWAVSQAEEWEDRLTAAIDSSALPDYPDREGANAWLIDTYLATWKQRRLLP